MRALEADIAEPSDAPELGGCRLGLDAEPAGSRTVTSTAPEAPMNGCFTPVSIRRTPSPNSTLVCSATFTSRPFEASAGRTSTVVSVRSAAMNRMRPAGTSRRAEIGAGVSKVCMVVSRLRCPSFFLT